MGSFTISCSLPDILGVIKPEKVGFVGHLDGYGENVIVQSANRIDKRAYKKFKGKDCGKMEVTQDISWNE